MTHRKSIMQDNWDYCYYCGKQATDVHHICNSPCKKASEKYGGLVHLCHSCHMRLHNNKNDLRELKQRFQIKFLVKHTQDEWMKEFHRNYL